MLHIPANLWQIIQQSNTLEGINLKPAPTPNSDGSYTIKLTPAEWDKFQANQANPPAGKPAPKSGSTPTAPDDGSVSVTKDPSTSTNHNLDLDLYLFLAGNFFVPDYI